MTRGLALAALLALPGCPGAPRRAAPARVMTGLDVLEARGFAPLRGKRVGVITDRTGVDADGRPIVELLADATGVALVAAFTPERGFAAGMRLQPAQLAGLDALVFDAQDAGARFYAEPAAMAMALEAAKEAGLEFYVLDRPNPLGGTVVEGPAADDVGLVGYEPTAYLPVVTRHGMTVGELALLHNATVRHPRLTVVKMRGWRRSMWYDQTGLPRVPPWPNAPDSAAAVLYPGIASLEFTNLSIGLGTASPYEWIGAPWLDAEGLAEVLNAALLEGVEFSADTRTPAEGKYAGQSVPGVRIAVTDRDSARPLKIFARLAVALHDRHPKDFDLNWNASRRLIGLKELKELYDRGAGSGEIERLFDSDVSRFERIRRPYLLYRSE